MQALVFSCRAQMIYLVLIKVRYYHTISHQRTFIGLSCPYRLDIVHAT